MRLGSYLDRDGRSRGRPPVGAALPRGLAGLCAVALLAAAGCAGDDNDRPPPGNQVDAIVIAVSNIVFQCRSAERGFISAVDKDVLARDVDTLVEATEEFDPDEVFRRSAPAVEPETTLRDQVELAIARLEENDCSPEDAVRLRDAIGD